MPVVSRAQYRKFYRLRKQGKITQAQFDEWMSGVNYKSLPERKVATKRKKKSAKRAAASRKSALKRLGRKKASGNFKKISKKAAKRYGSKAAGDRVAGSIYWNKVAHRKRRHR